MKKSICFLLLTLGIVSLGYSQVVNDEITLFQAKFGMEKKQLVEAVMDLSASAAPGFWMVYQQYEERRQLLARERILLINEYLVHYDAIDNEKADFLSKALLKNTAARNKLHTQYYKKFKKVVAPREAAKFLQLDNYIHSTLRTLVLQELPFIDEFQE
ncbi:hypothetical protein [Lunatimonas salinarum]|uniref:hypothetical protein n=1 Tax=Lunatimonas salinarum TaxID=1774590 RepID=UPI001ADF8AC3|nr:hypothetical protein [Lunatimonas salinarum]